MSPFALAALRRDGDTWSVEERNQVIEDVRHAHARDLQRYAQRRLALESIGSREDARDVIMRALEKLARQPGRYQAPEAAELEAGVAPTQALLNLLRRWIKTYCRNKARQLEQRQKREVSAPVTLDGGEWELPAPAWQTPEIQVIHAEDRARLLERVRQRALSLPPALRAHGMVLVESLSATGELPHGNEVAARLQISLEAERKRRERVLASLRPVLYDLSRPAALPSDVPEPRPDWRAARDTVGAPAHRAEGR